MVCLGTCPYQVDSVVVAGGHVEGVLHQILLHAARAHGTLSGAERGPQEGLGPIQQGDVQVDVGGRQ